MKRSVDRFGHAVFGSNGRLQLLVGVVNGEWALHSSGRLHLVILDLEVSKNWKFTVEMAKQSKHSRDSNHSSPIKVHAIHRFTTPT